MLPLPGRTVALEGYWAAEVSRQVLAQTIKPRALAERPAHAHRGPELVVRDLNLAPSYLQQISGFSGVRELVQNWFDEVLVSAGTKPYFTYVTGDAPGARLAAVFLGEAHEECAGYVLQWTQGDHEFVQLTNFGTVLSPSILALGHSEKRSADAAGCFGEGMKVEINRLLSTGANVMIWTGDTEWRFAHVASGDQGVDMGTTLQCEIRRAAQGYCGHTSFVVGRALGPETPTLLTPEHHLFLLENVRCARYRLDSLEILRDEGYRSRLYVKGNFVCSNEKLPGMGLNFVGSSSEYPFLAFGRDRNFINASLLVLKIPELFERATKDMLKLAAGSQAFQSREMELQDLSIFLYDELALAKTSMDNEIAVLGDFIFPCEALATALLRVFFKKQNTVPPEAALSFYPVNELEVIPDSDKWMQLEYLGRRPKPLHAPLAKLLHKSSECPTMEQLWAQAEDEIRRLPEWKPATHEQHLVAAKFRSLAAEWFRGYLTAEQIIFKPFPPGNVNQVVFVLHQTQSSPGLPLFCIDINLLDSVAVHEWRRRKLDEGCADERLGPDGIKRCGGSCILERFQTALQEEIGRTLSSQAKRKLEQQIKSAMLRRETQHLPDVDLPPTVRAPAPAASTAGDADGARAHTSTVNAPGNSHNATPTLDVVSSVSSTPQAQVGQRAERAASTTASSATIDAVATDTAALLRQRCLTASLPPELLEESLCIPSRPGGLVQYTERPMSEMNLVRATPIRLNTNCNEYLLELYIERRLQLQPISPELLQAAKHLAGLCALDLAVQLFAFTPAEVMAKVHIFVSDREWIGFNRGGRIFFNAYFYHKLNHDLDRASAFSYWFTTFCHELAHNVSSNHDQAHEEAEEALIIEYISNIFHLSPPLWLQ